MKKIFLLFGLLFFSYLSFSQLININPNPNAEPWIVGGLRVMSEAEINKIPVLENNYKSSKDLPTSLDNSTQPYFRPIFNQTDGCCAQASGIAYNFTYEMNLARSINSNIEANQYPTHFTYNFLNQGDGNIGSNYADGWEIIKNLGCPNVATYGGLYNDASVWISGYDKYLSALNNRVESYFAINVGTPEGLTTLKYWLYDHLNGETVGGLANFSAGVTNEFNITSTGKIVEFGHTVNHAMTIVGWDDNVKYDFNNDGQYTNNIDINGDNVVDMRDWEVGALIMVNSWGTFWGNSGKAYIMYKLLAEPSENGGILSDKVFSIKVKEFYTPKLTMKVKIEHQSRNKISIKAGVANSLTATVPEYIIDFPIINNQGGDFPLQGGSNTNPMEVTLDVTPLLTYINSGEAAKIFFGINEKDPSDLYSGKIWEMIVTDVAKNKNYYSNSKEISLLNNTTTWMNADLTVTFDAPQISTTELFSAIAGQPFSQQLTASGGTAPYKFNFLLNYSEAQNTNNFLTTTTQTLVPDNYDDGFVTQQLGFEFPFYGKKYSDINVSTDGSLVFAPGFNFIRDEISIRANKIIAVYAADLMIYPDLGDGIFYTGDQNSATFRWKCSLFEQPDINLDFAVTIYPSGEIEYFYGTDMTPDLAWAAGISNGDGFNYKISQTSGVANPSNLKNKFTTEDFPYGMEITNDGLLTGTLQEANKQYNINFLVTDYNNISKSKSILFNTIQLGINELSNNNLNYFPNPFTNEIMFNFSLNTDSKVSLNIYDITGKKVAQIIDKQLTKGEYNINWKNDSELKNGIYIIKFENQNQVITNKILKIN